MSGKDVFDRLAREVGNGAESLTMTHGELNALRTHLEIIYHTEWVPSTAPHSPTALTPRGYMGTFMGVPFKVTR